MTELCFRAPTRVFPLPTRWLPAKGFMPSAQRVETGLPRQRKGRVGGAPPPLAVFPEGLTARLAVLSPPYTFFLTAVYVQASLSAIILAATGGLILRRVRGTRCGQKLGLRKPVAQMEPLEVRKPRSGGVRSVLVALGPLWQAPLASLIGPVTRHRDERGRFPAVPGPRRVAPPPSSGHRRPCGLTRRCGLTQRKGTAAWVVALLLTWTSLFRAPTWTFPLLPGGSRRKGLCPAARWSKPR